MTTVFTGSESTTDPEAATRELVAECRRQGAPHPTLYQFIHQVLPAILDGEVVT